MHLVGQKIIDSSGTTHECDIDVTGTDFLATTSSPKVNYNTASTPFINSVSPRYGTVEGGTPVTFTGEGFTSTTSDYTILIDDVPCAVSAATTTSVTCTTGPRIGAWTKDPQLTISIAGKGLVAIQGNTFRYVSLWSSLSTWGGQFPPIDGESVALTTGINLLVDIDASPVLNLVILDGGSIIFPSNDADHDHQRTFDAHYIFLNNGALLEAGTEAEPYQSKLTITMHGSRFDPYIPKFGNKCIGVRFSTLDIHGLPAPQPGQAWKQLQPSAPLRSLSKKTSTGRSAKRSSLPAQTSESKITRLQEKVTALSREPSPLSMAAPSLSTLHCCTSTMPLQTPMEMFRLN
jgi:hypothetical protein